MQLLQDTFIIEQLQIMNEGKSNGPMKIRGVFGRCNEKNNNGRIYPTAVLESQLEKVKPLILERRLCGELDHPQNDTVKLSNASHLVTKLEMKGNDLIGEAEILKTPAGLTAKALVEGGVKIGISSRGMGTLSEDHNGDKIVNEDFRLVTFDLVADPSTRGAFPGLSESTQSKFVRESQSKLTKENNFVTMLESKMRNAYQPWIEEAKKKKAKKKDLPGDQEKIDADGDGKIEKSDFTKLRAKEDKFQCEAFDLVKADGIWHRFAGAILGIDEAFTDELDKASATKIADKEPAKDSGGILSNMRARSHAKKMEIAKGKGARTAAKHIAKGDVAAARIRQKATDNAAAGKPVTGGEKVAAAAKKAGGAVVAGAKAGAKAVASAPGKVIDKAVAASDASTKAQRSARLDRATRNTARTNNANAKKASGPGNRPKPAEAGASPAKAEATPKTANKKFQRTPEQEASARKRRADQQSGGAASAEKSPVSKSGAGVSPGLQKRFNKVKSKQGSSRQSLSTTRERMIKKGDLKRTGEGGDISASRSYKQIGFMLAEMLGLA